MISRSNTMQHVLYPFANQACCAEHPLLTIEAGDDAWAYDRAGKCYLDGEGGLWNVSVGHRRPKIKAAMVGQMDKISLYSMFGETTNKPAEELAAHWLPKRISR